ncbi:MAG: two-component system sensor histidine kinase NtrB [Gammaproteobacteria bacterium]
MIDLIPIGQPGETSWRALTYFNAYRFLVGFLFVSLYWIGQLPQPLGAYDSGLFSASAHIYLLISLLAAAFITLQKPPYLIQVTAQVLADIVIITLLMYSSAGLGSGFGMILVIVVAGGSLLSPGKIGILFAALAAIAVLGHELYSQLHRLFPQPNYTHAGFLGITFFVTAFICNALASRVEKSEALAEQSAIALQNLARLNEHIVQHLQSGIIVLDSGLRVTLINSAARELLNAGAVPIGVKIDELSARLAEAVNSWAAGVSGRMVVIPAEKGSVEMQASFSRLSMEKREDLLVFLDDVAVLRQRAQELKLASLGRLTANIAHEVRNPLGAISHASQLLSESRTLNGEEKRLTAIIEEHSRRVNSIVQDIMNISRRDRARLEMFELDNWLRDFTKEFIARRALRPDSIKLDFQDKEIKVRMDSDQLNQVLWNLCENGIRYSRQSPLLVLRCGIKPDTQRPYLEVIDNGPGIELGRRDQLFEPFFTTESRGTGLGLYIARELCEANQAMLHLRSSTDTGCCFRIDFAHPDRQHAIS